jgi:hypothetical protein
MPELIARVERLLCCANSGIEVWSCAFSVREANETPKVLQAGQPCTAPDTLLLQASCSHPRNLQQHRPIDISP